MLSIVATPIGNLKDITFRAIETLKEAELILAEDTRRTKTLLNHYEIKTKVESYHDHNKEKKTPQILEQLKQEKHIALVSDAGTPGISDPGFYLTRVAIQNEIKVESIPGACALITALTSSGCTTDQFTFYGFFPKKPGEQKKVFEKIKQNNITAIFYESPHRIKKTVTKITKENPKQKIVIARELTKKFEEVLRGSAEELKEVLEKRNLKGEMVLILDKEY